MPSTFRLFVCSAALVVSACDGLVGPGEQQPPLDQLPRALSAQERELIRASNSFAFDILRETILDQPADNVFLSPLSASLALGMTANGARGETQQEMLQVLGFGAADLGQVNAAYRSLIDLLLGLDSHVDMRVANSIWALADFPFHQSFYDTARHYFDAEVDALDFRDPATPKRINRWVEQKTAGRIQDIVPDPIPPLVVMYLINAIYFQADWQHRFNRSDTREATFTLAGGRQKNVMMMHRGGLARNHYDSATGAHVVELPYSRGAFAMTLVLPPADVDVDTFISALDVARWNSWIDAMQETPLNIGLPRFRLEYETKMNDPLITLGMGLAFATRVGTDFTGLSPAGRDLYISSVIQKTFIEVDEKGTEAAAATIVEISRVSAPPGIVFDRPFVLALRERLSGTIMFIGKVGDPASQ